MEFVVVVVVTALSVCTCAVVVLRYFLSIDCFQLNLDVGFWEQLLPMAYSFTVGDS